MLIHTLTLSADLMTSLEDSIQKIMSIAEGDMFNKQA